MGTAAAVNLIPAGIVAVYYNSFERLKSGFLMQLGEEATELGLPSTFHIKTRIHSNFRQVFVVVVAKIIFGQH